MINYYFKLNDETKKYLLKFKNDFYLEPLEDLAIYKDDEIKFYSCTHEKFNSMKKDYSDMTTEEIECFVNDNYFNENNHIVLKTINRSIEKYYTKEILFQKKQ